jgi:hypothetical protein
MVKSLTKRKRTYGGEPLRLLTRTILRAATVQPRAAGIFRDTGRPAARGL